MFRKLKAAFISLLVVTGAVSAEDFPAREVTIVAPMTAGGSGDIAARFLAKALGDKWGKPVVVENITGGGTLIGSAHVARAKPDGYTLLMQSVSLMMLQAVRSDLPFDVTKDLIPVGQIYETQLVFSVGPSVKANTIEEFIEEAKTREIKAATSGAGTSTHFANELLAVATGINLRNIHYKGGSESIVDVAAGRADTSPTTMASGKAFMDSGQIRPLAVMGSQRLTSFPDVPTLKERGIDVDIGLWFGIMAPAGTPDDIIAKLNADINEVMSTPEAADFMNKQQASRANMSQAEFRDHVYGGLSVWQGVAKERNITVE